MIKNIVFDFGNVIAKFEPENIASQFCDNENDRALLMTAVFENWADIDAGRIEYEVYTERAMSLVPARLRDNVAALMRDWYLFLPKVEGMEELIRDLKADGRGIYLLSNAPTYFSEKSKIFEVLDIFDGKVFSADIKLAKPAKEIFEYLFEKYSLVPNECLFVDDLPQNVDGAKNCGMAGYNFDGDTAKLREFVFNVI